MEFRIAETEFLRGLRLAQGIADRKSTMPMLVNVLLRTQGKISCSSRRPTSTSR
jgi:DNA polymerase III sliding clamp (beta) subunit (PCNA family)